MRQLEEVTESGLPPIAVLSSGRSAPAAEASALASSPTSPSSSSSSSSHPSGSNSDGLLKWRQQCLIEALIASDGAPVGTNRQTVADGRDDLVVANKGTVRAGMASVMTAAECAAVTRTIVFVNTVAAALDLQAFLKRAGELAVTALPSCFLACVPAR
jgi:hypothetical protein